LRPTAEGESRFRVLCVCTGNVCRSPIAEALLRSHLTRVGGCIDVTSAGTHAVSGQPMEPHAVRVLAELGGPDGRAFRSTALTAGLVAGADVILTAERDQRELVAGLDRTAWPRTFTLPEFARLVETKAVSGDDLVSQWRALVRQAGDERALQRPGRAEDDDIEDPMGARYRAFRVVGRRIAGSVATTAAAMIGAG